VTARRRRAAAPPRAPADPAAVLAWLKRRGSRRNVAGMTRYGIYSPRMFGVSVGTLLARARRLGKDHALAAALWRSGWYEARMLAAMVDEPDRVTRRQMDAWARAFDNWAICDTVCFHLFDRTPYAWAQVRRWATSPREFVKRAAFALLAVLALHDKGAPAKRFAAMLPLIARGARDERNFVKKAVSWALRSIGRRDPTLWRAAVSLARQLSRSRDAAPRWVGSDAVRELTSPKVRARLARAGR
jgi:3-methyladenine DNA glycosylase AlkD